MTHSLPHRSPRNAGIAIGPILFVIAVLGVLAAAMSSGNGSFGSAGIADRITADVGSQANLIRSKINECNLRHGTYNNNDGYPEDDSSALAGKLVSTLECEGDPASLQNLWSGFSPAQLPPPTQGFHPWRFVNGGDTGGRCFYTSPLSGTRDGSVAAGLKRAATKFSSQEVAYDYSSTTQKFVVFITNPTGTPNDLCTVP